MEKLKTEINLCFEFILFLTQRSFITYVTQSIKSVSKSINTDFTIFVRPSVAFFMGLNIYVNHIANKLLCTISEVWSSRGVRLT